MEIEIKKYIIVRENDFKNPDYFKTVNISGDLIFNEIPINNIEKDSVILEMLDQICKENNIIKNDYDIYFQRNKEWYHKFIFYKKNE